MQHPVFFYIKHNKAQHLIYFIRDILPVWHEACPSWQAVLSATTSLPDAKYLTLFPLAVQTDLYFQGTLLLTGLQFPNQSMHLYL